MKGSHFSKMILLLVVGLTAISGCVAPTPQAQPTEEPAEAGERTWQIPAEELRFAMLFDGPINDGGWNQGAYDGVVRVQEKYNADTAYTESVARADMESVFTDYAGRGYNVVMAHGFEFSDAAIAVAADYTDTIFIVTHGTAGMAGNNVGTLQYEEEQIAFVLGIMAGQMTESNKMAAIGGYEIPPISIPFEAFTLGAQEVNSEVEVPVTWIESWSDVAKMKEATSASIAQGADIILPVAVGANPGAFSAVQEADVWTVGYSGDVSVFAPDNTLTSAIIDTGLSIELVVDKIVDGTFEPTDYWYGIKDGVLYFSSFHEEVPQDVIDSTNEWMRKIEGGEYEVPVKMHF
jgi:basic membrane protein A